MLSAGSHPQSPHSAQGTRRYARAAGTKGSGSVVTIRQGLRGTKIPIRVLGRLAARFQRRSPETILWVHPTRKTLKSLWQRHRPVTIIYPARTCLVRLLGLFRRALFASFAVFLLLLFQRRKFLLLLGRQNLVNLGMRGLMDLLHLVALLLLS
jgi:hypothetical protein